MEFPEVRLYQEIQEQWKLTGSSTSRDRRSRNQLRCAHREAIRIIVRPSGTSVRLMIHLIVQMDEWYKFQMVPWVLEGVFLPCHGFWNWKKNVDWGLALSTWQRDLSSVSGTLGRFPQTLEVIIFLVLSNHGDSTGSSQYFVCLERILWRFLP